MVDRAIFRVRDMKQSIRSIRELLGDLDFDQVYDDFMRRAAFERFLEILSEASRSVPNQWKQQFGPTLPWRQIADLGNTLRHAYHRTDSKLLWSIYQNDLGPLEAVVDAILVAYDH